MKEEKNVKLEQHLITELPLIDTTSSQPIGNTHVSSSRFWSGSSLPKIKWQPHWKSLTIDFFPYTKFRIWCYWSKFREEKTSFTLIFFGKFFWVSTTHLGKRLGKRLFLNAFFGKDYHVYSSGDSISSNGG